MIHSSGLLAKILDVRSVARRATTDKLQSGARFHTYFCEVFFCLFRFFGRSSGYILPLFAVARLAHWRGCPGPLLPTPLRFGRPLSPVAAYAPVRRDPRLAYPFRPTAVGTGECPKPSIEPFDEFFSRVTGPLCLVSDRLHHRQAKAAAFFPTAGAR